MRVFRGGDFDLPRRNYHVLSFLSMIDVMFLRNRPDKGKTVHILTVTHQEAASNQRRSCSIRLFNCELRRL